MPVSVVLKLSILISTTVFSSAFWWGAEAIGFGFVGAFIISGIGSMFGVWAAWKFHHRYHG